MNRLQGKTALITGAARGQGAAAARRFVAEGARVVIADVALEGCMQLAQELGSAAIAVRLDVTSPAEWAKAVTLAETTFGALHVLVNNAGIVRIAPLLETSLEDYRAVVEVNQTGCFLGMKTATPAIIRAGGGAIVNVSSTGGLEGVAQSIAYAASKHAVTGMTKTAAIELGRHRIRVNSVHPGGVDTAMLNLTDEARENGFKFLPIGRVADPDEIARVVAFLASDDASYMTGSAVLVDGGSMAGPLGWNME
jgi:3alpha(or 20beta)-hydroxysteroid dehydrogenase